MEVPIDHEGAGSQMTAMEASAGGEEGRTGEALILFTWNRSRSDQPLQHMKDHHVAGPKLPPVLPRSSRNRKQVEVRKDQRWTP